MPFPVDKEHTHLGAYLRSLEGQVQAMTLKIEALRELLQEKGLISSASFSARVREIDGRDGVVDGGLQHRNDQSCGSCGRRLSWNARRCVYGGSSDPTVAIQLGCTAPQSRGVCGAVQHIAVGLWNTAGVVDRLGFSSGWLISALLRYRTSFEVAAGIDRSTSAGVAIGKASPFSRV